MKVNIYLGNEKLGENEIKKYKCVSRTVKDTVNEVYYGYLDELEKNISGKDKRK